VQSGGAIRWILMADRAPDDFNFDKDQCIDQNNEQDKYSNEINQIARLRWSGLWQ